MKEKIAGGRGKLVIYFSDGLKSKSFGKWLALRKNDVTPGRGTENLIYCIAMDKLLLPEQFPTIAGEIYLAGWAMVAITS